MKRHRHEMEIVITFFNWQRSKLTQRQMMKKKIFCGFLIKKKSQKHFSQITLKSECCETVAKGFRDRCDRNLLQSKALCFDLSRSWANRIRAEHSRGFIKHFFKDKNLRCWFAMLDPQGLRNEWMTNRKGGRFASQCEVQGDSCGCHRHRIIACVMIIFSSSCSPSRLWVSRVVCERKTSLTCAAMDANCGRILETSIFHSFFIRLKIQFCSVLCAAWHGKEKACRLRAPKRI